jgi:NTE family protein
MKDVLVHMIADDDLMNRLSASTKVSASPGLLVQLKQAGQAAASRFLNDNRQHLNHHGTVDLVDLYQ